MATLEGSLAGQVVVALSGDLDVAHANEAHKKLLTLDLTRGAELVLDLSDLTFMDSTGIRLILQAAALADVRGAGFVVVRPPPKVMRVLELVGLDDQLDLVDGR